MQHTRESHAGATPCLSRLVAKDATCQGSTGARAGGLAVIAYHIGFGWAPGGLLGVGVFFTLSGYLITDLLLAEHRDGRSRLGRVLGCGGPVGCCPRCI